MTGSDSFGYYLKRRRQALGITQRELAEQVPCSVSMIKKMEADGRRPSPELARSLADRLGVLASDRDAFVAFATGQYLERPPAMSREPQAAPVCRHNLPADLSPLVGRDNDLADLDALLAADRPRLISLIGPPGSGKTRLALAAAARQLASAPGCFPDGVFFVTLAGLGTPDQIAPAIAQALDIAPDAGNGGTRLGRRQLLDTLSRQRLLLVLDNFEHLLPGAGLVGDLLLASPGLKVLITSRQPLHLQAEQVVPIAGLPYPPPGVDPPVPWLDYPAIALFVARARQRRPAFTVDDQNATGLVDLCDSVAGNPLALELAAGWIHVLSPAEIVAEIRRNFDILQSDSRDVPARHSSLRATFDVSWELLDPPGRRAFARLSIFWGTFSREAAAQVAGVNLRELGLLVDGSLLHAGTAGGRYGVHQMLRQYGAGKLKVDAAEEADLQERHAAYYGRLVVDRGSDLHGSRQAAAMAELSQDLPDIQAAWRWAIRHERVDWLARTTGALVALYRLSGQFEAGSAILRRQTKMLERRRPVSSATERLLVHSWAWQRSFDHDLGRSDEGLLLPRALELLASLEAAGEDVRRERARVLYQLGIEQSDAGQRDDALRHLDQSLALARSLDDLPAVAETFVQMSTTSLFLGRYPLARQYVKGGLAIYQRLDDRRNTAWCYDRLGLIASAAGQHEEADVYHRLAIETYETLGDLMGLAKATGNLGSNAMESGRLGEARRVYARTMDLFRELGLHRGPHASMYFCLNAYVSAHLGDYGRATREALEALQVARELGDPRVLGFTQAGVLAQLALAGKRVGETADYAREGLLLLRRIAQEEELAIALATAGIAAIRRGDLAGAREYAAEALAITTRQRGLPQSLSYALALHALVAAAAGRLEVALELHALALAEPFAAVSRWFDDVVGRPLQAAAAALPPEIAAAAQARGRARDRLKAARSL